MSTAADTTFTGATASSARMTTMGRITRHIALFLIIVTIWELLSAYNVVDQLILPRPSEIAMSLVNMIFYQGNVWWHFFVTLWESLAGFVIGSAIGIALAVAAALNESFRRYISPYIVAIQVTPRIALAPLVIAWLGFGITPKIGIAALICFFPPFINTLTGLLNVDEDAAEMFRSLGAKKRQIFWSLMLPNAMPIIMAGLKTAISLALIGAIVGEFISASEGMGVLMQRYTFALNMASSFAILVILTVMGYLLFIAMEAIDNWLVFWRHDARMVALSDRKRRSFRLD